MWVRRLVIAVALVQGGWLAFDGGRALLVGEYVTARSGPYAGQLGPWSKLVSAVGIEPRSTLMKSVHLLLGLATLACATGFARRSSWGGRGILACAVLGLWYLPFGTLLGVLQIVLLFAWSAWWAYRRHPLATALLVVLVTPALAATFDTGNITFLCAMGIWAAHFTGPRLGGFMWALATALKWFPALLIFVLPPRARLWGIAWLTLMGILTLAIWPVAR